MKALFEKQAADRRTIRKLRKQNKAALDALAAMLIDCEQTAKNSYSGVPGNPWRNEWHQNEPEFHRLCFRARQLLLEQGRDIRQPHGDP